MRRLIDQFRNSDFAKSVALLFSGNSAALLFPFLIAPLISRLYSPSDFAGFELFVKVLMLFSLLGSLRFELAIIIPKEQSESNQLVRLCFRILFGTVILSAILVFLFSESLGVLLKNDDLPELLLWLPLGVLIFGSINILNQIMIRFRKYKVLAANKIVATTSNHLTKYIWGLFSPSSFGLVIGHILGTLMPALVVLRTKTAREVLFSRFEPLLTRKQLIKKYKDFPLVNSTHVLVDESSKTLFFFALSAYYGDIIFGLFAFTFRYLRVPIQVTGTSLAQVLNERLARMNADQQPIGNLVTKMVIVLALVGIVPFTVIFFFGEPIFSFVFSDAWSRAGYFAQLIAPWLFLSFVSSPISMLPIIVNRQKQFLLISALLNISVLLVLIGSSEIGMEIEQVISYVTGVYVFFHLILIFWFIRISRNNNPDISY